MKRLCLTIVLLCSVAAFAHAEDATNFDRWYVITLSGQRVGHAHALETQADSEITTTMNMRLTIRRGQVTIDISQRMDFVETPRGKPIRAVSDMNLGQMAVKRSFIFTDTGIEMIATQGDQTQKLTLPPIQGDWLPPAAASRYVQQQMDAGQTDIAFRTVDVSMNPTALDVALSVVGEENVEVMGKVVPAVVWDMAQSMMPGVVVREYVDHDGRSLKTHVNLGPGMDMQMIAADEALALAEVDPPEVMARTLLRPDRTIDRPRELQSAVYELRITGDGDRPAIDLPRGGYQRVVWGDRDTARVIIDLDEPVNPVDDLPTDRHREASTVLNHDDEKVRALVAEALGEDPDALAVIERAQRLRGFVHDYIDEKDLSIGFATASEVARTAQGDCSEHAVLLAAVLRAADIPSRTVSGLLYVDRFLGEDDVFGYHMWTQAWLPGPDGARWVDLDATLPDRPFDATHIALATSSMSDATTINDLVALVPLFGTLEVKVIEASPPTR